MGEIGEGDEGLATDAQQFIHHQVGAPGRLQRLAEDRIVETGVRIIAEVGVGVALHHR